MGRRPWMVPRRWGWTPWLATGLWLLAVLCLVGVAWLDELLRRAGRPDLIWLVRSAWPEVAATVAAVTVGAVLAGRRPAHPVGWLLLALGLSHVLQSFTALYARYGVAVRPGALPGAAYVAVVTNGMFMVYMACAGFVLLLTPTGTLPSPRWRWWARVSAGGAVMGFAAAALYPRPLEPEYSAFVNPLFVPALEAPLGAAFAVAAVLSLLGLPAGAASLVGRFRRARGVERLQLRWLAWGGALAAVSLAVAVAALLLEPGDGFIFQVSVAVCLALLPLATGAAILRYRLYDLDRIVSRTLTYGLLTLLLVLGYAGVVLGLGRLLSEERSSLVVAAATLAAAAVFQPARRRIQRAVDRRFNRRRHDAGRIIETFSARLRDQVDLDTLRGELLAVVDQTMQPTRASLWLRPRPHRLG
jgi:hypothetical protein